MSNKPSDDFPRQHLANFDFGYFATGKEA